MRAASGGNLPLSAGRRKRTHVDLPPPRRVRRIRDPMPVRRKERPNLVRGRSQKYLWLPHLGMFWVSQVNMHGP